MNHKLSIISLLGTLALACSGTGDEHLTPATPGTSSIHGFISEADGAGESDLLEGVEVCAEAETYIECTNTNENGNFKLNELPVAANVRLSFSKDGYHMSHEVLRTEEGRTYRDVQLIATDRVPELALEGGAILVKVATAAASKLVPMADTTVRLLGKPALYSNGGRFGHDSSVTSNDGLALFWNVEPGEVELLADRIAGESCMFDAGYEVSTETTIQVAEGAVSTLTVICSQ